MKLRSAAGGAFMLLGAVALPLDGWALPDPVASPLPEPTQQAAEPQKEFLPVHSTMQTDTGQYANGLFLAYIRSSNNDNNRIAELGLRNLAYESLRRSSIEPTGVVGLDIENDDLSLFPFLLFQITNDTPRLSEQARLKVQRYLANGGEIFFDVLDVPVNSSGL